MADQQVALQGQYLLNAVTEVDVQRSGTASFSFVETDAPGSYHMKSTFVNQAEKSSFSLAEIRLGGTLSRCALRHLISALQS